ncbi:acetylserotonin O-methyltransferase-like isoform X3 [Brachyhypopomus gauderio]|uniref:acetylserotonin O-methyltransferase-like isoform X3 n=1 Tax=Brachyhypopomus gauderio TaxID=698409 RepID=UPI00404358EC
MFIVGQALQKASLSFRHTQRTNTLVKMAGAKEDGYSRRIMQYMEGFMVSKTLFTACELGVFDYLNASECPLSAMEVAQGLGTSMDGMGRLLSACVGLELLTTQHSADGQVLYSNTEMSTMFLMKSSPQSLYHSVEYNSNTTYLCWHNLTDAVREGKNQYEKAFGVSSKDLFEALYRSDEEMVRFMQLMNSVWNICGKDVVTAFDLSPFKSIYDLGGCSGALAKQCVSVYPECTVTILDLPKVTETCRKHFLSAEDVRISICEGDFFKNALPDADLFILARILHDWTEKQCRLLLAKVYQSCKPESQMTDEQIPPCYASHYCPEPFLRTHPHTRTQLHISHTEELRSRFNLKSTHIWQPWGYEPTEIP